MNLNQLSNIIKTFILPLIILILLIIGAIFVWVTLQSAPEEKFGVLKTPKINSILGSNIETTNEVKVTFAGNVPGVLPAYEKIPQAKERVIAEKLGFKKPPQEVSGQTLYKEGFMSLRFKNPTSRFTFLDGEYVRNGTMTSDMAVDKAKNLMKELGLIDDQNSLTVEDTKHLITEKNSAREVFVGNEFNIYSITLGKKFGSFKLVDETASPKLAEVWVGKDGRVKKIEADTQVLSGGISSTYKIKSTKTAKEQIKKGDGIIVGISEALKPTKKLSIVYTRAQIAYLIGDPTENYIQPIYIFTGVGVGQSQQIELTTVLPAVTN